MGSWGLSTICWNAVALRTSTGPVGPGLCLITVPNMVPYSPLCFSFFLSLSLLHPTPTSPFPEISGPSRCRLWWCWRLEVVCVNWTVVTHHMCWWLGLTTFDVPLQSGWPVVCPDGFTVSISHWHVRMVRTSHFASTASCSDLLKGVFLSSFAIKFFWFAV
jgi:hypothetical protein